jgi:hypothetical protein
MPCIGARDDADAVPHGQPQLLGAGDAHGVRVQAQALHQLPQLRREGTHPDRGAVPADGRVDDDPGGGDGVEQVGLGAQALLGQAGEVLEAVDAGVDGVPRAPQGVGVGEDVEPGLVPEVDDQRRSSAENCTPSWSLPGVSMPPDAITLITSTPRSTCSATAERIACRSLGDATQVVAVPVGDGERRSRRHDPGDAGAPRPGIPASGTSGRPGRGPWSPLLPPAGPACA